MYRTFSILCIAVMTVTGLDSEPGWAARSYYRVTANGRDVANYASTDRTVYVPLIEIGKALGCHIWVDGERMMITVAPPGEAGQSGMPGMKNCRWVVANGHTVNHYRAGDGNVYVPVDQIARALDAEVVTDGNQMTITRAPGPTDAPGFAVAGADPPSRPPDAIPQRFNVVLPPLSVPSPIRSVSGLPLMFADPRSDWGNPIVFYDPWPVGYRSYSYFDEWGGFVSVEPIYDWWVYEPVRRWGPGAVFGNDWDWVAKH